LGYTDTSARPFVGAILDEGTGNEATPRTGSVSLGLTRYFNPTPESPTTGFDSMHMHVAVTVAEDNKA
jgi:hypothetical protein